MSYKISILDHYIEVQLKGAFNKTVAMMASSMLMELEEYKNMNTLWDFTEAHMDLAVADYHDVVANVEEVFPEGVTKNRSAFLVSSDFEESTSNLYINKTGHDKIQFRVFQSRTAAEDWVKGAD